MRVPRFLVVFFCAAVAISALGFAKALFISGLEKLPPLKVMIFAASNFGLIAALLDWALFRPRLKPKATPAVDEGSKLADSTIMSARRQPIVFREICPPPADALSFYGGQPVGPATMVWPRARKKAGNLPLTFVMQFDCAALALHDSTRLLPRDGALYLFLDLTWGDPFDYEVVYAPGPTTGWRPLPLPQDLPGIYGAEGAYLVPYCSPKMVEQRQELPRLLPRWPFTPVAFDYPTSVAPAGDQSGWFWNDGRDTSEALLKVQHPEGVPAPKRRDDRAATFGRPFPAFPHDCATVRMITARVLKELDRPSAWLMRDDPERESKFEVLRKEAAELYRSAAVHPPEGRVGQVESEGIWKWMETAEPVLRLGWGSLVEECVNVSLGLASEAVAFLPADLVTACCERHVLAQAYLHDEHPERQNPEALAGWEARKAAGTLKEVRSVHAPTPNRIFGPASYVQGYVEEYVEEWLLLLELSSTGPVGFNLGDGVLQFMIRPSDLRERRFDRVYLVASSY